MRIRLSRRAVVGVIVIALAGVGAPALAGHGGGGGGGGGGGNPGSQPYIQFKSGGYSVSEGTTNAVIQLQRVPKGSDQVYFSTNGSPNGAAGADNCSNTASDYITQTNRLVGIGSNGVGTALVPICNNDFFENSETVNLILSAAGTTPVGGKITAALTISDSDKAPILSVNSRTGPEGSTRIFTVTASSANPVLPMSVHWATADGTATVADGDYATQSGDVAIAPGATTTTFSVDSIDDAVWEPGAAQYFWVNLSSPVNASLDPLANSGKFTLTDLNDSAPTLSIDNTSADEGSPLGFTVTRSGKSDVPVTFDWATADGTATGGLACTGAAGSPNYVTANAVGVSIPASANATETSPVSVSTCDDYTLTGAGKTMSVNLSNVTGAVAGDFSADGTINDIDEAASLTLTSACDVTDCLTNSTSYTATVKDAGGNALKGALVRFEAYDTAGSLWDPSHFAFVQFPFSVYDGAAFDQTGNGMDINNTPVAEGAGDATLVLPPTGVTGPDGRNAVLACVVTAVAATPHCGYATDVFFDVVFTIDPVDQTSTPLVDWSYTRDTGDITF
jgi:hypothetical protein